MASSVLWHGTQTEGLDGLLFVRRIAARLRPEEFWPSRTAAEEMAPAA